MAPAQILRKCGGFASRMPAISPAARNDKPVGFHSGTDLLHGRKTLDSATSDLAGTIQLRSHNMLWITGHILGVDLRRT
jgi:hypothetical protein